MRRVLFISVLMLAVTVPAAAQLGKFGQAVGKISKAKSMADQIKDLVVTEQEEKDMGAAISTRLRQKYGVVQDAAVHKYVSLVGRVVASSSTRPNLAWNFIVLDTDGVNAFAAPGGFVHITRGALALIANEAELAGVLGHEITHITAKHTLNAIKNKKLSGAAVEAATRSNVLEFMLDAAYANLLENQYDRDGHSSRGCLTETRT
jgi:predicted Zn-dependent protease